MTAQDSLVSFIKACDLFGESFTFKIRKKKYYTSIVGGFTSLCFIIYSIYYFTSSLADFFGKNNRTIEKENNFQLESEVKFANHSYFAMAFCLRDNSMWIDEFLTSKIKPKAYFINNKIENKILFQNKKEISLDICNSDILKNYFGEYSKLQQFDGCRCLNMTSEEISLKTKYELIDKEFIQVEYEFDERNKNDVLKYLEKSSSRLFVYFPSFSFSTKNLENPLQMTVHQENYELIPNYKHESHISISQLIFNDFNSLYDDENSQILSRLTFEETKTNFFPLRDKIVSESSTDKSLVNIKLDLSNKAITFTSKVLLYNEFLGNFVGYLSNIIIILYCFNGIYNSFGARVYFAEKFFVKNKIIESKIVKLLKEKLNLSDKIGPNSQEDININMDKSAFAYNNIKNQNIGELDFTKRENNHQNPNINSFRNDLISNDCIESENSLKKKLFSQNELQITDQKNYNNDNTYLEDPDNISHIVHIINPKIKRNKLVDEKDIVPPTSQRNLNHVQVQNKQIDLNKMDSNKANNMNLTTIAKKIKNNNFKFNFFEYFWLNLLCCFKKNEKINRKNIFLDNSEDFCDYYLDVNTYIKKMIEIDLLKLYLIKNKDDLKAIENFKPAMKIDYTERYNEKIERLYTNVVNTDLETLPDNIKNMDTKDERIYKEILSFYNSN